MHQTRMAWVVAVWDKKEGAQVQQLSVNDAPELICTAPARRCPPGTAVQGICAMRTARAAW